MCGKALDRGERWTTGAGDSFEALLSALWCCDVTREGQAAVYALKDVAGND